MESQNTPHSFQELLERIPSGETQSRNGGYRMTKIDGVVQINQVDPSDPARVLQLEMWISPSGHTKRGSLPGTPANEYSDWILENFDM